MKKKTYFVIILISFTFLFALSNEVSLSSRMIDNSLIHDASNISFRVSNYGILGSSDDASWPSLEWPINSGIDYLYQSSLWVGAKKVRRNEDGDQIYWQNWPPGDDNDTTTDVTPWRVVDTLTTVGCDGWYSINELLPAYNPHETSLGYQYSQYNFFDSVLKNVGNRLDFDDDDDGYIDEDPLGNPFDIDDPSGIYCFTVPFDEDGDGLIDEDCNYPGFESSIAYSYDYSPFGTEGQRDYGSSSGSNNHVELDIALVQEIYSWPVQYFANMIVIKNIIYNHSTIDTLFDFSYAYYVDADIGPQAFGGSAIAPDDISSYNIGENNFAYAYDRDGDGGLTQGYFGLKNLHPDNLDEQCWTWEVSWGPDDRQPFHYVSTPNATANEKYWLLTGRNPDVNYAVSIRDYPEYQINNYPNGIDTRFLSTVYGDMQGYSNPTPNSLNLAPEESYEFYTLIFMGYSVQELENNLNLMENFIDSGFDYSLFDGLPSIPYLINVLDANLIAAATVRWNVLSAPDEFMVCYKEAEAPAYTWEYIVVDHALSEYTITDLQPDTEYKFKVACLYDEVYLESRTLTVLITEGNQSILPIIEIIGSNKLAQNYPNPFNPETSISYDINDNGIVELNIYNIKGQLKKQLVNEHQQVGTYTTIWDGSNSNNKKVSSGLYFYKLLINNKLIDTKKMIMLK